jgi:hypothetical protein
MPSPFPGMDPYLEAYWGDAHVGLIAYARDQLNQHLPPISVLVLKSMYGSKNRKKPMGRRVATTRIYTWRDNIRRAVWKPRPQPSRWRSRWSCR